MTNKTGEIESIAEPDDAGFEKIVEKFRTRRKKKLRRLSLILFCIAAIVLVLILLIPVLKQDQEVYLTFRNEDLGHVINSINSSYEVEIKVREPELLELHFSGTFIRETPDKIVAVLSESLELSHDKPFDKEYIIYLGGR